MNKRFPRGLKIYLPLVLMVALFIFLLPRSPRFSYEYKKGDYWMHETLVAEFDFPILKTDEQLDAEKEQESSNLIPYFKQNEKISESVLLDVENMYFGEDDSLRLQLYEVLSNIYRKGVFNPADSKYYDNVHEKIAYCHIAGKEVMEKVQIDEVYTLEKAKQTLKDSFFAAFPSLSQEQKDSIYTSYNLASLIQSDMEFDRKVTEERHADNVHHISPTRNYISRSETIVEKGGLITDSIANLLDSYKAEFKKRVEYSGPVFSMWAGISGVALVLVILFFFMLYFCNYRIFSEYNKYLYVLLLFALFNVITFMVARYDLDLFYLVPYCLLPMFLMPYFRRGFVMTFYCVTLMPLLIVAHGNMEMFFMHLTAGFMTLYVYRFVQKSWHQFVASFCLFLIMGLVWMFFSMMFDDLGNWSRLFYIALCAGLSIAGFPLIYMFERMFALVSSNKLVELSDTSNSLLRLLADKAPGTFHHSLQVMNIADAAARAINADVPLIRAAALYHDIGKIKNPQCFTENEIPGVRLHEGLTPKESAALITKHVTDGLALAEKHGLPKVLRDFIVSHHGTTSASYFLTKYLNEGGDPKDTKEFYYDGVKPATKEQVILMLSDAVEAASRSLKDYSSESISKLVDRIFDAKANEGQFTDADISLREINTINEVMKSFLLQIYHSRIEYPKMKTPVKK